MKRFVCKEQIYRGRMSVVHRATDSVTSRSVIVKRCFAWKKAKNELDTLLDLETFGARNVVSLEVRRLVSDLEISGSDDGVAPPGGLRFPSSLVLPMYTRHPGLCYTDQEIGPMVKDVLTGLMDIHMRGYIHRDIKPDNILFDDTSKEHKIIDFGLSIKKEEADGHPHLCGTPFFLAPETVNHLCASRYTDMYSLGVTIYSLLHGGRHPVDAVNHVTRGRECRDAIASIPYDPRDWTNELAPMSMDLCSLLLKTSPSERVSASEALFHPLVREHGSPLKTEEDMESSLDNGVPH